MKPRTEPTTSDDWRKRLGQFGEAVVCRELEKRGWIAVKQPGNFRNIDVVATKAGEAVNIQVKTHSKYRWVFGGGVNEKICRGAPLFNRARNQAECDFVILLSPTTPLSAGSVSNDWRFFVMPLAAAEAAFRINIDAYFNQPKRDGSAHRAYGAVRDFVGPGELTHGIPDHREDYLLFEGAFRVLERQR